MIKFIGLPGLLDPSEERGWLEKIARKYKYWVQSLVYNFVDTVAITEINNRFLGHDYPTDIITFNYGNGKELSGEVFLCPEVIKENARDLGVDEREEILRVMAHGMLHMVGYDDQTEEEKKKMRSEEEKCLILHPKILKTK